MSLINEALKKAQERISPPPAPPPEPDTPIAAETNEFAPVPPREGKSWQIIIGMFAVALVAGVGIVFLILGLLQQGDRSKKEVLEPPPPPVVTSLPDQPTSPTASTAVVEPALAQPVVDATAPPPPVAAPPAPPVTQTPPATNVTEAPVVPTPAPTAVAPAPPTSDTGNLASIPMQAIRKAQSVTGQVEQEVAATNAVVVAEEPPPPPPPAVKAVPPEATAAPSTGLPPAPVVATAPPAAPEPVAARGFDATESEEAPNVARNPAVEAVISRYEIRGMMAEGKKVLLFDPGTNRTRSFRVNDMIDPNLKITLKAITKELLIFTDDAGARYTKYF